MSIIDMINIKTGVSAGICFIFIHPYDIDTDRADKAEPVGQDINVAWEPHERGYRETG